MPLISAKTVVEALFNQESVCDLCLELEQGAARFHVHRAVVIPQSDYLKRFAEWEPTANTSRKEAIAVVKVALPSIQTKTEEDLAHWFEIYLRVLYGLHSIRVDDLDELEAVIQIADFMVSTQVLHTCNDLLCEAEPKQCELARLASICQRFPALSEAMDYVKDLLVDSLYEARHDPFLFELEAAHFADIIRRYRSESTWPFWTLLFYVGELPLSDDDEHDFAFHIKTPEMVSLFKTLFQDLSQNWSHSQLVKIARRLVTKIIHFDPPGSDQTFPYRHCLDLALKHMQTGSAMHSRKKRKYSSH